MSGLVLMSSQVGGLPITPLIDTVFKTDVDAWCMTARVQTQFVPSAYFNNSYDKTSLLIPLRLLVVDRLHTTFKRAIKRFALQSLETIKSSKNSLQRLSQLIIFGINFLLNHTAAFRQTLKIK